MPLTPYGGDGGSDWLQSLLASYGAGQPYGPGGAPSYGVGPRGAYVPGGGVTGYQAATPGAASMGYPAMGQPGPQAPPAPAQSPPFFQFGGFHPENILQSHPPGSATLGPVFNASGSPGGPGPGPGSPGSAGDDGGFNNQYMAAATANPAQGGPYVGGQGVTPTPQTYPHMPWPDTGSSPAATVANAPPGNPSATPRPARPVTPTPAAAYPKRSAAAPAAAPPPSNPRFGQVQYQVPGSGMGPLSRSPIYSTLNLFGGGQQPAVNPNVPAANAQPVSGRLPGGRYINPQPPGGPPDYGMAPVDITGYPVIGVNAARSPDMTPDQLARAVRKPKWWRNV